MLGADGEPAQTEERNGTEIFKTGFDDWDEEEKRWADQKPLSQLIAEHEEVDILAAIDNQLDKKQPRADEE